MNESKSAPYPEGTNHDIMKKIMCCLLLFSIPMVLCAQAGETLYGFQVSPTFSSLNSDDNLINGNGTRLGFKIGGLANYYVADWLVLDVGFGFGFSQGGKLLHKIGGNLLPKSDLSDSQLNTGTKPLPDDVNISYSLHLLEIEAGFKYLIPLQSADFDLFLSFPTLNLGIVGQSTGSIEATGIDVTGENVGKDVTGFNLSWGFGTGIQKSTQSGQALIMGLMFQRGFADLTRDDGVKAVPTSNSFDRIPEDSDGNLNAVILKFALLF